MLMRATYPLLACALGLLFLAWPAHVLAQPGRARPSERTTALTSAADARAGRGSLQPRCARCHDGDGTGNLARENLPEIPDFSNHRWQVSRTDAQLMASILDGKGNHMPSYRGKVNEKEARDLVAQVRDLDPAPAARPTANPPDDFERRFRALQEELEELKKQFREVSASQHKP